MADPCRPEGRRKSSFVLCVDHLGTPELMSAGAVYFLVFGPVVACGGLMLLLDFKGLGRRWESELNRNAAYVGRVFGWPPNRYFGPTSRPFVGVFALLVGVAMFIGVVTGVVQ